MAVLGSKRFKDGIHPEGTDRKTWRLSLRDWPTISEKPGTPLSNNSITNTPYAGGVPMEQGLIPRTSRAALAGARKLQGQRNDIQGAGNITDWPGALRLAVITPIRHRSDQGSFTTYLPPRYRFVETRYERRPA